MSTQPHTVEDHMMKERTGHLPSYMLKLRKMKSLTLKGMLLFFYQHKFSNTVTLRAASNIKSCYNNNLYKIASSERFAGSFTVPIISANTTEIK